MLNESKSDWSIYTWAISNSIKKVLKDKNTIESVHLDGLGGDKDK